MLSFLPKQILAQVQVLEDLPGYLNTKQLMKACEVKPNIKVCSWASTPKSDLRIGQKYYWKIDTPIARLTYEHRIKKQLKVTNKVKFSKVNTIIKN